MILERMDTGRGWTKSLCYSIDVILIFQMHDFILVGEWEQK